MVYIQHKQYIWRIGTIQTATRPSFFGVVVLHESLLHIFEKARNFIDKKTIFTSTTYAQIIEMSRHQFFSILLIASALSSVASAFSTRPQIFSTMRVPHKSSSTSLHYQSLGDCEENFRVDILWETAMYERRKDDVESQSTTSSSTAFPESEEVIETTDSELVQAAKAFIPVAIEISLVAAVASAQRPFIFQ